MAAEPGGNEKSRGPDKGGFKLLVCIAVGENIVWYSSSPSQGDIYSNGVWTTSASLTDDKTYFVSYKGTDKTYDEGETQSGTTETGNTISFTYDHTQGDEPCTYTIFRSGNAGNQLAADDFRNGRRTSGRILI